MKIGELGRASGVSAKTIRYYEEIGLIDEPARSDNGYRDYDPSVVERLRFSRDSQAAGLSLTEIATVVEMRDRGEGTCEHVVGLLEHHLEEIDRQIRRLRQTRKRLVEMTGRAKALDPSECVDADRCQTIAVDTPEARRTDGTRAVHPPPSPHGSH